MERLQGSLPNYNSVVYQDRSNIVKSSGMQQTEKANTLSSPDDVVMMKNQGTCPKKPLQQTLFGGFSALLNYFGSGKKIDKGGGQLPKGFLEANHKLQSEKYESHVGVTKAIQPEDAHIGLLNQAITKASDLIDNIKIACDDLSAGSDERLQTLANGLPAVKQELLGCVDDQKKTEILDEIKVLESTLADYGIEIK